jgi:hypothetical protein
MVLCSFVDIYESFRVTDCLNFNGRQVRLWMSYSEGGKRTFLHNISNCVPCHFPEDRDRDIRNIVTANLIFFLFFILISVSV